jgi:PA14 domain
VKPAALGVCACLLATAWGQETAVRFGTTVVIPAGLRGQIYHIKRDSPRLPNLRKLKPVGTIYTTSLNVPPQMFDEGFPGVSKRYEWFAIDYTGRFWVRSPGFYRFVLTSDDGSKLFIDDKLIIDNDGQHPPLDRYGEVELAEGIHRIEVEYFQGPRFHVALVLRVAPPGENLRIFHVDEFKPPPDVEIPEESPPPEAGKKRK